jgi:hypothetical protein
LDRLLDLGVFLTAIRQDKLRASASLGEMRSSARFVLLVNMAALGCLGKGLCPVCWWMIVVRVGRVAL